MYQRVVSPGLVMVRLPNTKGALGTVMTVKRQMIATKTLMYQAWLQQPSVRLHSPEKAVCRINWTLKHRIKRLHQLAIKQLKNG